MNEYWSNVSCGSIQLLLQDILNSIWYSLEEKIDDLRGLKDEIDRMIKELENKLKEKDHETKAKLTQKE